MGVCRVDPLKQILPCLLPVRARGPARRDGAAALVAAAERAAAGAEGAGGAAAAERAGGGRRRGAGVGGGHAGRALVWHFGGGGGRNAEIRQNSQKLPSVSIRLNLLISCTYAAILDCMPHNLTYSQKKRSINVKILLFLSFQRNYSDTHTPQHQSRYHPIHNFPWS
jgi:hypothetical protein